LQLLSKVIEPISVCLHPTVVLEAANTDDAFISWSTQQFDRDGQLHAPISSKALYFSISGSLLNYYLAGIMITSKASYIP
jgi:hypothetical protein